MLDIQPSTIIFTIINLLVLYFFFRKFLFGRVNAVLEEREQLILHFFCQEAERRVSRLISAGTPRRRGNPPHTPVPLLT